MRAMAYTRTGGPDVLVLVDRPDPAPGPGEVVVRMARYGVNPTDWKLRRGITGPMRFAEQVPGQDGSGIVAAVGAGVSPARVGQRVWVWEAAHGRPGGCAQELLALPAGNAVPLPEGGDLDLGACLGVPALTAHRALTVAEDAPATLAPGALRGVTVLVAGGAGAVGHAAIELARWAGATVVATVSSDGKATLARAAGAHHVVDYAAASAADDILAVAPGGVATVVEVAPSHNGDLDRAVLAPGGTIASYANDADTMTVPIWASMSGNVRYQFVLLYSIPAPAKAGAVEAVTAAVADGALRCGTGAGLPLHHMPFARTADAHAAVEGGIVGKVLVDLDG